MLKRITNITACLIILLVIIGCKQKQERSKEEWVSLFNGRDLTGWDIKIKDHPMNENYKMNITVRITELVLISKIARTVPEIIQKKFNQINEVDLRDSTFF